MANRQIAGDLAAVLSYSTLLFSGNLAYWLSPANAYYHLGNADGALTCVVAILMAAAVGMAIVRKARKRPGLRKPVAILTIPLSVLALSRFRVAVGLALSGSPIKIGLWGLFLLFIVVGSVWRLDKLLSYTRLVCLAYFAFVPLAIGRAILAYVNPYRPPVVHRLTAPDTHPLVLWVIFDELDQSWLFERRPQGLHLPNFDAFRATSLTCLNAARPGPETMISLPALTTGRRVDKASPISAKDVGIQFHDGVHATWAESNTIFDDMPKIGRSTAIVGFYHNYAEMFAKEAGDVYQIPHDVTGFLPTLEFQLWVLVGSDTSSKLLIKLGPRDYWNQAGDDQHRVRVQQQTSDLSRVLAEGKASFVFAHLGVPHSPWISDKKGNPKNGFEWEDYLGNLVLADKVLGGIVEQLKATDKWNGATVLVSADHNFRQHIGKAPLSMKVPLMLKLPQQDRELDISAPIDSLQERGLIHECAVGTIRTPERAAAYLRGKSSGAS